MTLGDLLNMVADRPDAPKSTLPDIMRRGTPSRVMAPADPTLGHLARTPRRYPRDPMTMADAEAGLQAFPRQMRGNVRPYPPEHPAAYSDPVAFANQELAAPALADVLMAHEQAGTAMNPATGNPLHAPASSMTGIFRSGGPPRLPPQLPQGRSPEEVEAGWAGANIQSRRAGLPPSVDDEEALYRAFPGYSRWQFQRMVDRR